MLSQTLQPGPSRVGPARACNATAVASKYDEYWLIRRSELGSAIERAAAGEEGSLDVSGLRELGQRESWYGSATVQGSTVVSSAMAHATSLARVVTGQNMCSRWPEKTFRFTISNGLTLAVVTRISLPGAAPSAPRTQPLAAAQPFGTTGMPESMDVAMACERVHGLLEGLPVWRAPSDVTFDNGLYFFYETGERSHHAVAGRVVRVGNHPHAQQRLRGRLKDHFRSSAGAKNGSVFRRYIGGAVIRRENAESSCLAPGRGEGHWERQKQPACTECGPVETRVTDLLNSEFSFRCVRIDDMSERNTFEAKLIATLAKCPVCKPSQAWLGRLAYPRTVSESGLWNTEFVGGPTLTQDDMRRLGQLVDRTRAGTRCTSGDLQSVLLVIPCSGWKRPRQELELPPVQIAELLGPEAKALLSEGRRLAFDHPGTRLHLDSPVRSALTYYTGQPYATTGVKEALVAAIGQGLHCLIISGGYGVVRPEEPIHKYNAHLGSQTKGVWSRRLPVILHDYIERNQINESIVLLSQQYAACVPELTANERRFVPSFRRGVNEGAAEQVVPAMIGSVLASTLASL
jgi:hypothetical protein